MHQSSSQIFPLDYRIRIQVIGWYIFPCFNPICSHELSSALPNQGHIKNQSFVYFTPKPGLSNLAYFITPVIRPLLPHRTTCSVLFRFMPTLHPVQCISASCAPETEETNMFLPHVWGTSTASFLSWHRRHIGRGSEGTGVCWGRSCKMRDIHTNAIQMQG